VQRPLASEQRDALYLSSFNAFAGVNPLTAVETIGQLATGAHKFNFLYCHDVFDPFGGRGGGQNNVHTGVP